MTHMPHPAGRPEPRESLSVGPHSGVSPGTVRRLAVAVVSAVLSFAACSSPARHPASSPAASPLTLRLPASDAREVALPSSEGRVDGNLLIVPLGVECGLTFLIGTHAEIDFSGQLCRLHVAVENQDRSVHSFATGSQRLIDRGGIAVPPDHLAMEVTRQIESVQIGGNDTAVVTLYFKLATGKQPVAFELHGDQDPTGIGTTVTAPHLPRGLIVTIPKEAMYQPKPI
jgi:hypothetical protein